jgi:hypothetical protein
MTEEMMVRRSCKPTGAKKRMPLTLVGQFTLEDNVLSGPREYMEDQGEKLVNRILAGDDTIFNLTMHQSPNVETAILVCLQTDYAGWLGVSQAEGWLKNG